MLSRCRLVDEERLVNQQTDSENQHRYIRSIDENEVRGRFGQEENGVLAPYNPVFWLYSTPNNTRPFVLNHYHTNDEVLLCH